ncbi:MAG TPA: hypothetical protein VFA26_00140, partial [Gemmataceae bacterium]|nr:hypothetical protein [Gemmataceae bacterium]
PNLPSLALDTPARMTAPRLPRSAGKLPPPALDDTLRLPSAPADDPALTTLRDSPLLALTSRDDDPPPAVTTPVPPPAYPPLPVTGWEPPARAPDETPPDLAAPPVPQRVGGPPTAASPGESPALLPLTGAGRSWGAGDTVTLK